MQASYSLQRLKSIFGLQQKSNISLFLNNQINLTHLNRLSMSINEYVICHSFNTPKGEGFGLFVFNLIIC